MKKNVYCGNCGEFGHLYRRCTQPITSLGLISYRIDNNKLKYLMIQRRDTIGFVEFMRGKYNLDNYRYIYKLFTIMTEDERKKIESNTFDYLWNNLWMDKNSRQYHNEYDNSKKKFQKIVNGFKIDNTTVLTFKYINSQVDYLYTEPEWGFPKGRRNLHEDDITCATREFEEETGLKKDQYIINNDLERLEEIFLGSNNIRYKHVYYLALYNDTKIELCIDKDSFSQASEVSNIKWFNYEEALEKIRPYNKEKKDILMQANKVLLNLKN
jgi:8-oxo-dGTP pyrophosphatase MutT (NUDIX family)